MDGRNPPIDFGDLRHIKPVDSSFGLGRGKPVDRYYIEHFLGRHASSIRGRVLEVAEDTYTVQFGGARVSCSDILHVDASNPRATLTGVLVEAQAIPDDAFDCFICTHTLTYIYEVKRAVSTIHRMLKPGGVVLVTVPGISQISPYDRNQWGEYWRFTARSLARLLGESFRSQDVVVEAYGNVLTATAFLQGLCIDDLRQDELDHRDDRYPMLVAGRAVKFP